MNKYTKLSDFEINKRIAEMNTENRYVYFEKEQTIFRKFNNGQTQKFNPCNYPVDAMPIIIKNNIDLLNGVNENLELCEHHSAYTLYDFKKPIASDSLKNSKTIYRLAMEVYLMIKDAEREANT
ncbi:DUF2591 domain-containing protein [Proteus sp. G2618]|uniref:phage protein NinX family protein n=1 Tax=Proteus sp. G2618 TaxID=2698841 RepID=UPI0013775260|nr:phage protein NinX family protein [Proteus sp. G2618]NBN70961.1 DUF2591 domain-containing protein [Proteus sp. G2618]